MRGSPAEPGVIPRAVQDLFDIIQQVNIPGIVSSIFTTLDLLFELWRKRLAGMQCVKLQRFFICVFIVKLSTNLII